MNKNSRISPNKTEGGFLALNKEKLPHQVIVVEGKSDVARLSSYFDCEFVITNGSEVPSATIEYLKNLPQSCDILILTDPDYPGLRIRNQLAKELPNAKHAFVRKEKSIKGKKLGVAECETEELLTAIKNAVSFHEADRQVFDLEFLYQNKLIGSVNSKKLRDALMDNFKLGYGNAKTLLKRLNTSSITKEEIIEFIKEH